MRNTVAIIGAGQLGSRHLQGVLKSHLELDVFVLDLNIKSLEVAEARANEIEHNHNVHYVEDIEKLPQLLDLVIVATNADVRAGITQLLVSTKEVKYLILEKVLFPKMDEYLYVKELLEKHNVVTWVNHPRRSQSFYKEIKTDLDQSNNMSIEVYGQNWGLACNGLHLLDLVAYLSNSEISTVNTDNLDSIIHESKRNGYIELTGSINGLTQSGANYNIRSVFSEDGKIEPLTITVCTPSTRIIIQEGAVTQIMKIKSENNFLPELKEFKMLFQSDLSRDVVNDILTTGTCDLPDYNEAMSTHKPFIDGVLKFYNKLTNQEVESCPIT